ncbi:hypothetical protein HMPREF9153_0046 [Cutibacterium avidum ATCC 25577]|uniref:Uncharacterized protein n=1 Tax=Cutibacterium avidum ATCC 25577 TaxID=997355 RepID=G4CU40_9ACTN|nr:hypothetical protein HMPREF9153_0046 [Cutibacterium avidum ATCC 25577]
MTGSPTRALTPGAPVRRPVREGLPNYDGAATSTFLALASVHVKGPIEVTRLHDLVTLRSSTRTDLCRTSSESSVVTIQKSVAFES